MLKLTAEERHSLRKQAHALSPVVLIGNAGLTDAVLKEIDRSLDAHGLIKVRVFGDDRAERDRMYQTICAQFAAAPIQHIGKLLVIYRPKKERPAQPAAEARQSTRQTPVSRSSVPSRRTPKRVIKGNMRVTPSGKIKRAKTRQTSIKKRMG
jgi:putative YhbY family RNA-binding protein